MGIRRVAIPTANSVLSAHFGGAEFFTIYELEGNDVLKEELLPAPPHEPGSLPKFLVGEGVTDIIVGGIGGKAIDIFTSNNISVHAGANPIAPKNIIQEFANGTIQLNSNSCNHDGDDHEHHHGHGPHHHS